MTPRIQFFFIFFSIMLLIGIIELTRRKKIRQKYSLFWILVALTFLIFSVWRNLLFTLANFMGIYGAENAVFIVAIVSLLLLLLTVAVIVSRLFYENKKLSLKVAILQWKVEQMTFKDPCAK